MLVFGVYQTTSFSYLSVNWAIKFFSEGKNVMFLTEMSWKDYRKPAADLWPLKNSLYI